MKKIRLFSAKAIKDIEGEKAELYVNFCLVLNRNYIFTFAIEAPNLMCSDRHPIRLWKHFLMVFEEENVKYMRRYENTLSKGGQRITREEEKTLNIWEHSKGVIEVLTSYPMGMWLHRRDKRVINEVLNKIRAEIEQEYKDESEHPYGQGLGRALQIIDKHKAESEDAREY